MRRVAGLIHPLGEALRTSVRTRLLVIALLPLVFVLPGLLGLVLYWSNAYFDRLLVSKVTSDLVVADQYFQRVVERMGQDVSSLAQSRVLIRRLAPMAPVELTSLLAWKRDGLKLDFLRFHSAEETLMGADPRGVAGQALAGWPTTALDVYSQEDLAGIDPALARLARLELIPTPNAAPDPRREETRGLVIHSAVPVYDDEGALLGILEGGMLLNQNLNLVDTLNDLVYRPKSMFPGSHGTATLFLGDVRVATNVRLFEGQRALGTRVSRQVRDRVLGEGQTWQDRAFVVKDWYMSGYQPLVDSRGERVGMLYVGFLEAPFRHAKQTAVSAIVLLVLAVGLIGAAFFWRWARDIFQPLERMDATLSAVEAGDLMSRTGPVASRDEIGRLARHLDALLDTVAQRNRELADWAASLDLKVAERTAELTEANARLIETQRQLAMSGKLAAIGELTAGVAHEINNPVAVMQGNLDLMRQLLGDAIEPVGEEMRILDEQVWRIQQIVSRLLQFARPQEYAGYTEQVDINTLLEDCLILVRHQLGKHFISVEKRFEGRPLVEINRGELQQVVINLLVNAIHAMPAGGLLTLGSRNGDQGLEISVRDTGVGIARENLERIFDPFFTTKRGEGTGLGLSISYTLLARYGGRIDVASEPGKGALFTIRLPPAPAGLS